MGNGLELNSSRQLSGTLTAAALDKQLQESPPRPQQFKPYLYDVGDVGIRLCAARVIDYVQIGVKMHQRPFAVLDVVGRVSVFSDLKHATRDASEFEQLFLTHLN